MDSFNGTFFAPSRWITLYDDYLPGFATPINVINFVIWILTILGNLLTLIVIVRYKTLHTPSNYIIASLAMADMLVGMIRIVVYIIERTVYKNGGAKSDIYVFASLRFISEVPIISSICHLFIVALDRLISITYPLRYDVIMTSRNAKIGVVSVWMMSAVLVMPVYIWPTLKPEEATQSEVYLRPVAYALYFVNAGCMFVIYARIFMIARQHQVAISATGPHATGDGHVQQPHAISKTRMKATRKLSAILLAYVITWTPFIVLDLLVTTHDNNPSFIEPTTLGITYAVLMTMGHMNSALNVFVYAVTSRSFCNAYIDFFRKVFRSKGPQSQTMASTNQ